MPLHRFDYVLAHLHLNNISFMPSSTYSTYNKLDRVRQFVAAIRNNFEACFIPGEVMPINKSMIKFKGRSGLKQYIPKKSIKRGF